MAWPFRSGFFGKPSGLAKPCTICAQPIPFDPNNPANPLCASCSYQANNDMAQIQNDSTFSHDSRNTYSSYSPLTPSSGLKRSAEPFAAEEHPIKRALTSTYNAFTNPLIRRTVVGPAAPVQQFGMPDFTDTDGADKFQDAREQPSSVLYEQNLVRGDFEGDFYQDPDYSGAQSDDKNGGQMEGLTAGMEDSGMMDIEEDEEEEQEADLFYSTFGRRSSQDSDDEEAESVGSDDDNEGVDEVTGDCEGSEHEQEASVEATSKAAADLQNKQFLNQQDIANVGSVGDKTLGSTASRSSALLLTGPRDPDPEKDLSQNLRQFEKFKDKAVELIPQLPLSSHRYWIGVLHEKVKAKNVKNETDFSWMKGNRLTTVRTVWHTYSTTTASEDFALLLGYERPELDVRMEELDYFNEKKIIFRAVAEGTLIARGKEMCEGLIPPEVVQDKIVEPEVIELD